MKKKFLSSILLLLTGAMAFAQGKFAIQGRLTDTEENFKVFLNYVDQGTNKRDSTISSNGQFSFSGTVAEPTKASLEVRPLQPERDPASPMERLVSRNVQDFFLEEGSFTVSGSTLRNAKITGGPTQTDYLVLKSRVKSLEDEMAPLSQKLMALPRSEEKARETLVAELRAIRMKISEIEIDFIKEFGHSYVSLDLLKIRSNMDPAAFEPIYNSLSVALKNTEEGKKYGVRMAHAKKTAVGQPAINFTKNMIDGKPLDLASLKGKYVLLDFWGSWCGPCRASFPHLKELYSKYKDQGFEVVGIAYERRPLEASRESWKKAIEEDGLPWLQVLNEEDVETFDAVAAYGINAFPTQVLLDKDGKIIARYIGESRALDRKLEEVFGN